MNKKYTYHACFKDCYGGEIILKGRQTCREAYNDLRKIEEYTDIEDELIDFIGVIKRKNED